MHEKRSQVSESKDSHAHRVRERIETKTDVDEKRIWDRFTFGLLADTGEETRSGTHFLWGRWDHQRWRVLERIGKAELWIWKLRRKIAPKRNSFLLLLWLDYFLVTTNRSSNREAGNVTDFGGRHISTVDFVLLIIIIFNICFYF